MWRATMTAAAALAILSSAWGADLRYEDRLGGELVKSVPAILKTFDPKTGRFGSGIFCCGDQNVIYPLAVAYATPAEGNPYHKDAKLLEVVIKAGDALIEDADENGQWVFRKKDGSEWGNIWMPWTYSRWVRAFGLIREDMPPERRQAWTDALLLGYKGISRTQLGGLHNIPTHHAMGLYAAGKLLKRPKWCEQAAKFMLKVVGHQSEAGYWSEGGGPVVAYNFVYIDALGTYYAVSGDRRVLPALKKAGLFHRHFTYPGGQNVETVDQRNPFHDHVSQGNVGFTFTAEGRAYLQNQWARLKDDGLGADLIASLLLYGEEGPLAEVPSAQQEQMFVLSEDKTDRAATIRRGPWFVCLSAYTVPISTSRWIQDRQNFVSVYHDKTGLILGGGNTKLQPVWSNFTVGDVTLLAHKPGDTSPDFRPKGELYHVPKAARLLREPSAGLELTYGEETCTVRLQIENDSKLKYLIEASSRSGLNVAAHLTLLPHLNQTLETAAAEKVTIAAEQVKLSGEQIGGWISYAGYRLGLPGSASLNWPALRHNPYRKDGRSTPAESRIEVLIPFDRQHRRHEVTLEILP